MNSFNCTGRLGNDPELKTTSNGKSYCRFNISVDRRIKSGDVKSDWFSVTCWGQTAEYVCNYLAKGRLVAVCGRVEIDKKDDKQYINVIADTVEGLDRPRDDAPKSSTGGTRRQTTSTSKPSNEVDPFAED